MTPEARAALCRRIAEALEPMLANTDGEWVKLIDGRSEFYSKHRLWQYERTSHDYSTGEWVPRPLAFAGNGQAMLALIAAMLNKGFEMKNFGYCGDDHRYKFSARFQNGSTVSTAFDWGLPLAVLLAAARALGVEETTE